MIVAVFCSLATPVLAQCINGLPCLPKDDTTTRAEPDDASPANISKNPSATCDADFMNQIYARAYIEAEREVVMASVAIKKPDSVLEYTCFDQLAYQGFRDAKTIFSGKQFAYQRPTYVPPASGDFADSDESIDRSNDPATDSPDNGGTYSRTGKVSIDYDGSPTAYHPSDAVGDDYLQNAGRPGNWWGIVTNSNGTPYVQPSGYYISTTSWVNPNVSSKFNQRRFVNAEVIPYVAMTSGDKAKGMAHGDFVLLTNTSSGAQIWSMICDYAGYRANPHAELSPEAARLLGISFTRNGVGSSSQVKQEFFKGSRISGFFPEGSAGRMRILKGPDGVDVATPSSSGTATAVATPTITIPTTGTTPTSGIIAGITSGVTGVLDGDITPAITPTTGPIVTPSPDANDTTPTPIPTNSPLAQPAANATGYERWLASIAKEFESVEILTMPAFADYLKINFGHKFLGRDVTSPATSLVDDYVTGLYKRSSYNCPMMDMVHILAKCTDFGQDYNQFFSLEQLATGSPRSLPARYACGKGTKINQDLIDVAMDKDMENIEHVLPNKLKALNEMPDGCGQPLDTGLPYNIILTDIDSGGETNIVSNTDYQHKVCANPVCTYDPVGDSCVKK